jgi:hypothetical protein
MESFRHLDMEDYPPSSKASELELFELYCAHAGRIDLMVITIKSMSPEEQVRYPSRSSLYSYQNKHRWRERFAAIKDALYDHDRKKNGLTYERINLLASVATNGLLKRLADALNSTNPKDMTVFTGQLFEAVWRIHRTERNLPTAISQENAHMTPDFDEIRHRRLDALGYGGMSDAVEKMTPELMAKFLDEAGISAETPPFLRKD